MNWEHKELYTDGRIGGRGEAIGSICFMCYQQSFYLPTGLSMGSLFQQRGRQQVVSKSIDKLAVKVMVAGADEWSGWVKTTILQLGLLTERFPCKCPLCGKDCKAVLLLNYCCSLCLCFPTWQSLSLLLSRVMLPRLLPFLLLHAGSLNTVLAPAQTHRYAPPQWCQVSS